MRKMFCYLCGKDMRKGNIVFRDITLCGWVCECGEEIIPSKEIIKYEVAVGRRKSEITTITKIGNDFVVSIPHKYVKKLHIKKGTEVLISKVKGELKITPL